MITLLFHHFYRYFQHFEFLLYFKYLSNEKLQMRAKIKKRCFYHLKTISELESQSRCSEPAYLGMLGRRIAVGVEPSPLIRLRSITSFRHPTATFLKKNDWTRSEKALGTRIIAPRVYASANNAGSGKVRSCAKFRPVVPEIPKCRTRAITSVARCRHPRKPRLGSSGRAQGASTTSVTGASPRHGIRFQWTGRMAD